MKVVYDSQTDTINVISREERIKESDEVKEGVILNQESNKAS